MDLNKLNDNLVRLDNALKKAREYGIDPKKDGIPSGIKLINYKEKRKEHYHNIIKNCIKILKEEHTNIDFKSKIGSIERSYFEGKMDNALEISSKLLDFASSLEIPKSSYIKLELRANFPVEIKKEIEEDFKEIKKCFDNGCYRSVMVLCGRILEIALHRKYYETTGIDILEKSPGIGLGNLVARLKEKNVKLDPGITQQIHLVNQIRVFSVHKKKEEFSPSKEQAHAMILYTTDIISKLF